MAVGDFYRSYRKPNGKRMIAMKPYKTAGGRFTGQRVPSKAEIRSLVKQEVKKQEESRYEQYHVLPDVLFNSIISSTSDIYQIIPPVGNGNLSYQRVGDKITPTKCLLKMHLGFASDDTLARDITAHVFVLRAKAVKSARLLSSVPITDLLDAAGAGGSVAYDGTIEHSQMPVETTNFSVVSRKAIRLQKVATASGSVMSQNTNTCRTLTIPVKLPVLKYDISLDANNPQNDFPFLVIGYTYNTPNSSPDTLIGCLRVEASTQMWYKDA